MFARAVCALSIALVATFIVSDAYAWGQTGHRVTGAIAERYLSGEARAGIKQILGDETLAEVSNWPDVMRSDPAEFWQKTANPWHYVTVPPGKTYADVGAPPEGDAVSALQQFTKTVRDETAPLADRQLALRFIVHIIGDLHQPFHAGNGTDRGGNEVRVRYFGDAMNLHSLWDNAMIDRQQLSYSEMATWLLAKVTPDQLRDWSNADPLVWIGESTILRDKAYPTSENLSYEYDYEHIKALKERLLQAGIRMAAYLNSTFAARQAE
jgi:hypothetical protein